jgi:hypothetical protein
MTWNCSDGIWTIKWRSLLCSCLDMETEGAISMPECGRAVFSMSATVSAHTVARDWMVTCCPSVGVGPALRGGSDRGVARLTSSAGANSHCNSARDHDNKGA